MTDHCSICLDNLNTESTINLKCNHLFHRNCLKKITNNKCPLCRSRIIDKSICDGHTNIISHFNVSYYRKNGKCTICKKFSFKHLINNL